MAEAKRNWIQRLVLGVLFTGAAVALCAQSTPANSRPPHAIQVQSPPSGALAGRLTDLHSAPLAGVVVLLRNQATGAESHATTARNGTFRFASLNVGEYTLEADEPHLGHGHLEGILVSGGMEARVQAALRFEPAAPALLEANEPNQITAPSLSSSNSPSLISAQPAVSSPPAAANPSSATPRYTAPHHTINTSTSVFAAPIAAEPFRTMALAAISTPVNIPRGQLEIQSASIQLALVTPLPHAFPLVHGIVPVFAANIAAVGALHAAIVNLHPVPPVVAAAAQPEPVTAAVATTVSAAQMQALPVSGRRWQDFVLDTPAATTSSDSSQTSYRATQASADVTIDGSSTRLAFGAGAVTSISSLSADPSGQDADQQSSPNQAWTGGRGFGVSEAAVHQVTAEAGNVEAEGLRAAGGRTTIETESGSDAFHGQGFLFDRQNNWGAQNPFTQWLQNTGTAASPNFTSAPFTPLDHELVWGLGMGSRIRRKKLFWFAALDSYRRNDPGVATAKNPIGTNQYGDCVGLFCSPSVAQIALLSAQLGESLNQAGGDYLGVPTSGYAAAGLEQLASLLGPAPRSAAQWMGFGRIDWQAAERHHFTLEGIGADWNSPGGGLTRVSENFGSRSFGSSNATEQLLLGRWEAYLTPNLLAVSQASEGRDILTAKPDTPSAFEQAFLSVNSYGQLPQILVDSANGFTIGNPSRFGQGSYPDEKLYHGQEMLDWVHNHLLVKAGFEFDHNADATSLLRNQTGTYSYSHVANFISDALAFQKFGFGDALDPKNPHDCGATNTTWGSQPCYSYYSQTMGPTNWDLSTNDWAGYSTAQLQLSKITVLSAGLRWEREQMPPPIAALANPDLPLTETPPSLGNNWGPRIGVSLGNARSRWPVLRLGYGMYYGRTENATIETALTQTGSLKGDLNFFLRPSDDCQFCSGGAPPFPYVFQGLPASVVKPGAVEFAPNFRSPEVHQAVVSIEQPLPSHVLVTASALASLGRRLPVYLDTNFDPTVNPGTITATNPGITFNVCDQVPSGTNNTQCGQLGLGPIKAAKITVPAFALWPFADCVGNSHADPLTGQCGWLNPGYQEIDQITSRANSTYEAAMVKIARYGRRGLSLNAHYTYAHAMDWNPDASPLDPASFSQNFAQEYGTGNLDVRHSAVAMFIYETPWKLRNPVGSLVNGWMISGIGQFHSGLPYTMRTSGSLPQQFTSNGVTITGLRPGINGSGGDNRIYGLGSDGVSYNIGRNTFRYPETWKADMRLSKRFNLGEMRQLELMAESFNLFNHQNVTEIETTGYTIEPGSAPGTLGSSGTLPSLNFLSGLKINSATGLPNSAFGQPLNINGTNFYRERQIQLGLRMRF